MASTAEPSSPSGQEESTCWICLEAGTSGAPLSQVCGCRQRLAHRSCVARWQLHSAGKQEESTCRFCHEALEDWRPTMTPRDARVVVPFMRVSFGGRTFKVQVKPGPEGAKEFEDEIRKLLNLPTDQEFDVIFHCKAPGTGDRLQLQGLNAFDAAVHCASLSTSKSTAKQADANTKQNPNLVNKAWGGLSRLFSTGSRSPEGVQDPQELARTASAPSA